MRRKANAKAKGKAKAAADTTAPEVKHEQPALSQPFPASVALCWTPCSKGVVVQKAASKCRLLRRQMVEARAPLRPRKRVEARAPLRPRKPVEARALLRPSKLVREIQRKQKQRDLAESVLADRLPV